MRKVLLSSVLALTGALTGCGGATSYVHTDTTLGRVVVYRNGVAYFERYANVAGDQLRLAVPADKVDDFLKSLTVVDAVTGEPAPVAYPTGGEPGEGGLIEMDIRLPGPAPHRLKLSYVTEAPSWKPSYRVTLGKDGRVGVQAWAIVDNTSGEDWKQVKLGVGSSSAMSFRFDLRSVRVVERETLNAADLFAVAPPTGESTFADNGAANGTKTSAPNVGGTKKTLELSDAAIAAAGTTPRQPGRAYQFSDDPLSAGGFGPNDAAVRMRSAPSPPPPVARDEATHRGAGASASAAPATAAPTPARARVLKTEAEKQEEQRFHSLASSLRGGNDRIVVEGYASASDGDKATASLARANQVREQLLRAGVDANRVVAVGKGADGAHPSGVRIVQEDDKERNETNDRAKVDAPPAQTGHAAAELPGDPIGTSHFETGVAMTVPRGSSAMVSILHSDTDGEVVYLYDPETARGNAVYPFRSVRIKNPTDSALESGPVTVFGDGKFIGEGMCEPIPARSTAFVPFALDRQIVVDHKEAERDEIARILTVQRGVLSTQVQHTRKQTVTLHNRLAEKATVYLRHTVAAGYKLAKSPPVAERMGNADLFRVELAPNAKVDVDIEESTPVLRTTDLRSPEGLDLVKAFVSSSAAEGPLKASVAELLQIHRESANMEQHIQTTREQMQEYRQRMDELHAQIVTLKMVKTAGPLMQSLEKKMQEVSDKLSKATIDVVALEEQLMVARVHFQDKVADLTLEKPAEPQVQARQ
jgi:hypothetical protein